VNRSLWLLLAVIACLAALPFVGLPRAWESVLYMVFHWIALATSWNLLSGYSGYFSFGHGAFFGIGMYTTAVLATRFDMPFLWTLPAAALVAALFGSALGAVAFRVKSVRGEVFALLTLAATFVVATVIVNTPIDGGPGVYLNAVVVPVLAPTASGSFYLLALLAAALAMAAAIVVFYSRFGTGLFAIRDDEDVAEVMGVPTYRYKLLALALSSGLAGLVGGIHALFVAYVTTADTFGIMLPLTVVLMAVLGGSRHWAGPAVGAVAINALLFGFTSAENAIAGKVVLGLVLILVILFMPHGVVGRWTKRRAPLQPQVAVVADAETPKTPVPANSLLLSTRGLAKSFNGVQALRGVDVDVRRGEILGLLGPNGSGKSTFINVVSGHYLATAGQVKFDEREVTGIAAHRVARSGIARTYQIPRPFANLTVLENVALTSMFGAEALGRHAAEAQAWQWLAFTGLSERAGALPDELNLHQRKFLEFARALAARPQLLMLDEVLSGLTPSEIDGAVALIERIRAEGTTIVFVEHVMRAVAALCDRIVVFDRGAVLASGTFADVMARPEVVVAYLGKGIDAGGATLEDKPDVSREAFHAA
ncbi:MAG: branched-chain amino acid transporter ATP-binding protein/permease, partial [Variovorax sp.]|nr:branched-chain amino acid transporter ATP-binding protein/permease [Variovorax sp.]